MAGRPYEGSGHPDVSPDHAPPPRSPSKLVCHLTKRMGSVQRVISINGTRRNAGKTAQHLGDGLLQPPVNAGHSGELHWVLIFIGLWTTPPDHDGPGHPPFGCIGRPQRQKSIVSGIRNNAASFSPSAPPWRHRRVASASLSGESALSDGGRFDRVDPQVGPSPSVATISVTRSRSASARLRE